MYRLVIYTKDFNENEREYFLIDFVNKENFLEQATSNYKDRLMFYYSFVDAYDVTHEFDISNVHRIKHYQLDIKI